MAPVKKPQPSTNKSRNPSSSTSSTKPRSNKSKSQATKGPPGKQVKTKPANTTAVTQARKRKKPTYTDAQLGLAAINGIVPAHAAAKTGKGTGKKRDKIFVDDTESMMTILAMVTAEKEGQIESKVIKARRLEEIREARRKESEKRAEGRKGKFEEVKTGLKRKKSAGARNGAEEEEEGAGVGVVKKDGRKRKSVSFAT